MRRALFIVIALGMLAVATIAAGRWLVVAKVAGRKTLPVEVLVIDTEVPCPLAGVTVSIFRGPRSPFDGSVAYLRPSDFLPDPQSPYTKSFTTDAEGRCRFDHSFFAAWSEGSFDQSGYVDTSKFWLHLSAPDRPATVVPLDRYSYRTKDIAETSPLFVTVALNKSVAK